MLWLVRRRQLITTLLMATALNGAILAPVHAAARGRNGSPAPAAKTAAMTPIPSAIPTSSQWVKRHGPSLAGASASLEPAKTSMASPPAYKHIESHPVRVAPIEIKPSGGQSLARHRRNKPPDASPDATTTADEGDYASCPGPTGTVAVRLASSLVALASNGSGASVATVSATSTSTGPPGTTTGASEPYDNCTASGGGCVVFMAFLASCMDDICACENTFAGQVCAQCLATDAAVSVYNAYLKACEEEAFVHANRTIDVKIAQATVASASTLYASGSSDAAGFSDSSIGTTKHDTGANESSGNDSLNASGISHPSTLPGSSSEISASTAAGGLNETGLSGVAAMQLSGGDSANPSSSVTRAATIDPSSTENAASATTSSDDGHVADTDQPSGLIESHKFFQDDIGQSCQSICDGWQAAAGDCVDDSCICTSDVLSDAAKCSSCVGQQAGSNPSRTDQISHYSRYAAACRSVGSSADSTAESKKDPLGTSKSAHTLSDGDIPSNSAGSTTRSGPSGTTKTAMQADGGGVAYATVTRGASAGPLTSAPSSLALVTCAAVAAMLLAGSFVL